MKRYRKRPTEVDAARITDAWFDGTYQLFLAGLIVDPGRRIVTATANGFLMTGRVGDWLVRLEDGTLGTLSDENFRRVFEAVPDAPGL